MGLIKPGTSQSHIAENRIISKLKSVYKGYGLKSKQLMNMIIQISRHNKDGRNITENRLRHTISTTIKP